MQNIKVMKVKSCKCEKRYCRRWFKSGWNNLMGLALLWSFWFQIKFSLYRIIVFIWPQVEQWAVTNNAINAVVATTATSGKYQNWKQPSSTNNPLDFSHRGFRFNSRSRTQYHVCWMLIVHYNLCSFIFFLGIK